MFILLSGLGVGLYLLSWLLTPMGDTDELLLVSEVSILGRLLVLDRRPFTVTTHLEFSSLSKLAGHHHGLVWHHAESRSLRTVSGTKLTRNRLNLGK